VQKKTLDQVTIDTICDQHRHGISINELVSRFGTSRRVIIRTLKENGVTPLTKSELLMAQFPVLNDKDALERMYSLRCMSIDEIAHEIGTNSQVIKSAFKRLNINTISPADKKREKLLPSECLVSEYWHTEYIDKKKSIKVIAKQLGISCSLVETMLDRFSIQRRTRQEALKHLTDEERLSAKIARRLRSRTSIAIKNGQKGGSAIDDLGCSLDDFKVYLESRFQKGMSWENYGYNGWHMDHIVPLDSFDLSSPEEFKKACHYTNIQPLWAEDNFTKSSKTDKQTVILLCGAAGSGKSYIANQLGDLVEYVSYDNTPKIKHYDELKNRSNKGKYILYDAFRAPGTFIKNFGNEFDIKTVVIKESKETLASRIKERGGQPNSNNIDKAIKTVDRWIESYSIFSGTSQEVLDFLRQLIANKNSIKV
jgi:hypothetical protein